MYVMCQLLLEFGWFGTKCLVTRSYACSGAEHAPGGVYVAHPESTNCGVSRTAHAD